MDKAPAPDYREELRNQWSFCKGLLGLAAGLVLVYFLFGVALGPIGPGNGGPQSMWMQQCRAIGLAMYAYATDHDNLYPDGASSTEVFQKLLDGGYAADPLLLYVPMPGKTPGEAHEKLKPENVCFDVTAEAKRDDSDQLPLVFTTGFRVTYEAGGGSAPLHGKPPAYGRTSTWLPFGETLPRHGPGIAVCFKGNYAMWISAQGASVMNGVTYSLQHFVPANFDAKGKTYRQLTPDGVLR